MKRKTHWYTGIASSNTCIIVATLLLGAVYLLALAVPNCYIAYSTSKNVKELTTECNDCFNRIDALERENAALSRESDEIISKIYDRVCEIEKEHPDEIRGAVVASVKSKMNEDVTTRKATVLALFVNYEELKDDPEIQEYLSKIERIDSEIDKNIVLVENIATLLEQYSDKVDELQD